MYFLDRKDAGQKLVAALNSIEDIVNERAEVVVVGLPRGGVVVAAEIARAFNWPLDIVLPRKISLPGHEEYAIGAIDEHGNFFADSNTIKQLQIPESYLKVAIAKEMEEVTRRTKAYRGDRPPLNLKDKVVILVDDGIATGYTIKAALSSIKQQHPKKIILAVPVAPPEVVSAVRTEVDEVVCLFTPEPFGAVGRFYQKFDQTEDDEVIALLQQYSNPS